MYLNIKSLKKIGKMDKRGIVDLLYLTVIIVTLAIFVLILGNVVGDVTDELRLSKLNESEAAMVALDYSATIPAKFDYVWFTIFMILILGTLISSALISVHKIFVPIYILLFGLVILIGVIMNNVYETFRENAALATASLNHPYANAIIGNYVLVLIGIGVLSMILIFGKTKRSERL